jgi:hypothetical protein
MTAPKTSKVMNAILGDRRFMVANIQKPLKNNKLSFYEWDAEIVF